MPFCSKDDNSFGWCETRKLFANRRASNAERFPVRFNHAAPCPIDEHDWDAPNSAVNQYWRFRQCNSSHKTLNRAPHTSRKARSLYN